MCLGKKRHWSLDYARRVAKMFKHLDHVAYRCGVCGSYHVGSRRAHTESLQAERDGVAAALRSVGRASVLTRLAATWEGMNRNEWRAGRSDG